MKVRTESMSQSLIALIATAVLIAMLLNTVLLLPSPPVLAASEEQTTTCSSCCQPPESIFKGLEGKEKNRAVAEALSSLDYKNVKTSLMALGVIPKINLAIATISNRTDAEEIRAVLPFVGVDGYARKLGFVLYGRIADGWGSGTWAMAIYSENLKEDVLHLIDQSLNGQKDVSPHSPGCGPCTVTGLKDCQICQRWDNNCLIRCGAGIPVCAVACAACLHGNPWACATCLACAVAYQICSYTCCLSWTPGCCPCKGAG